MKLTENENVVLARIVSESNFNGDRLDLTKNWDEAKAELESDCFQAFADYRDYGSNYTKHKFAGIIASLSKKGLIQLTVDDFLLLGKTEFNKIKECVNL